MQNAESVEDGAESWSDNDRLCDDWPTSRTARASPQSQHYIVVKFPLSQYDIFFLVWNA